MKSFLMCAVFVASGLLVASPASAQVQFQGLGGATDAAEHATFFAGIVGIKVSFIEIDLEAGHLQNILPKSILDQIHQLEQQRGLPLQSLVRVPATYGAGSVRFIWPSGVVRPFVSGGFGLARLSPQLDLAINGIDLSDVLRGRQIDRQTSPMVIIGGGLRFDFNVVNIEGGYRYYAILSHLERTTDLSRDRVLSSVNAIYGAFALSF